ncbi:hypothetical protein Bbelb_119040 [Branchiostoma belcheri]|nr:hypothetical protein Bbelb_119040 [Branchiostoma belcheri]
MNIRQHIGVIFTSVGLILLMMGTITPAWTSHQVGIWPSCHENTTVESPGTAGLWEECSNMSGSPHWVSGHKIGGMSGLEPRTSWFRVEHAAATPHDPTTTIVVGTGCLPGSNSFPPPSSTGRPFHYTPNTDCPAKILDRGIIYADTLDACAAACCRNPMCQSFQYNCAQVCYLKEAKCSRRQKTFSECGNTYDRPEAHSTAYHIARFCIMLSTMLLLPGAFLAVSAACKGGLDTAVDGYTIFTTLIIFGGRSTDPHAVGRQILIP